MKNQTHTFALAVTLIFFAASADSDAGLPQAVHRARTGLMPA